MSTAAVREAANDIQITTPGHRIQRMIDIHAGFVIPDNTLFTQEDENRAEITAIENTARQAFLNISLGVVSTTFGTIYMIDIVLSTIASCLSPLFLASSLVRDM